MMFVPLTLLAQTPVDIEEQIDENIGVEEASSLYDMLTSLRETPLSINDTAALSSTALLSPFQLQALKNYILLYGKIIDPKELALIPGFDSSTIARLLPYITMQPYIKEQHWNLRQGHHNVVAGLGGTIEQAAGYKDGRYEGDNMRALFSYQYKYKEHISLRFCADKDPMEAWGKDNFYNYHLMISDIGRLERLIIGRYTLQFGQGLTLWTSLSPYNIVGQSPVRYATSVRPSSAFYEQGYQEGVATTISLPYHTHLSAFVSSVNSRDLIGGNLRYSGKNLIVGVTAFHLHLADSINPSQRIYNSTYFRGNEQSAIGIEAMYQYGRFLLFGETSMSDNQAFATLFGSTIKMNNDHSLSLTYRHYDPLYHNMLSDGYAVSETRNENGLSLDMESILPFNINARISLDLHAFPTLRYGAYQPSHGSWLRLYFDKHLSKDMDVALRYSYRQKERNIPNSTTATHTIEQNLRHQIQAQCRYQMSAFTLSARAIYNSFDSESNGIKHGFVALCDGRYTYRRLQTSARITLFNVSDYYARIYTIESNLQYMWSIPALYGKGFRTYLLLRYNLTDNITLSCKYALTLYFDQTTVGSGASQTDGNHRQTWMLQARWKI